MTAKRVLDEGLIYEILSVVEEIPRDVSLPMDR